MTLHFEKRTRENPLKKVLIYGYDGTGKSTFAEKYCNENGLKPVVIDVDDTNFTSLPIVTLRGCNNSIQTTRKMLELIKEVSNDTNFDTIIIDGVSSLFELLVGNGKGLSKYSERSENGMRIFRELNKSELNIIFIGQADMEVIVNEDNAKPNKLILKVNSMVNEKYLCQKIGNANNVEVMKKRTVENSTVTKNKTEKLGGV